MGHVVVDISFLLNYLTELSRSPTFSRPSDIITRYNTPINQFQQKNAASLDNAELIASTKYE